MIHRIAVSLIVLGLAGSTCLGQSGSGAFTPPQDVPDTGIGFRGDGTHRWPQQAHHESPAGGGVDAAAPGKVDPARLSEGLLVRLPDEHGREETLHLLAGFPVLYRHEG